MQSDVWINGEITIFCFYPNFNLAPLNQFMAQLQTKHYKNDKSDFGNISLDHKNAHPNTIYIYLYLYTILYFIFKYWINTHI